jgi:DNA mismatch endonuclease (patch repair protein)
VFLDGCWWHRCPEHGSTPRSNTDYWRPKLEGNVHRDRRVDAALAMAGWTVIRVWEHENPDAASARVSELAAFARDQ